LSDRKPGDLSVAPDPWSDALAEAATDGLLAVDTRGRIEAVNPSVVRMFGYASRELLGLSASVLMCSPHRERFASYLEHYLRRGHSRVMGHGREVRARRKDGTTFSIHLSVRDTQVRGRRIFAANLHDLTLQKALEGQLLQAQKMETIGTLAGEIAHDFSNLLTSVLGSVELAQRDPVPPGSRLERSLARIALAGRRGEGLIKQLLFLSRKKASVPDLLDIRQAVIEARQLFERLLPENIELEIATHTQSGAVWIDPTQLDQMILNLVVNARDAISNEGKLRISTRLEALSEERAGTLGVDPGSYVCLCIEDSGSGIEAEHLQRIFDPFFTTKPPGQGTGLGLSTVHNILRENRGAVEVQSARGQGTRITLFLPLALTISPPTLSSPTR